MPEIINVSVLVGSLRQESVNRKVALALAKLAPERLDLRILEIGDLPHYNEDVEAAGPPESWTRLREAVRASDAVLFVTPEYNRAIPGALKNAIDVGSRPYGHSAWDGKPAGVASVSPGAIGGFGANHHLRQSLVFLNMPVMQQPEAYFGQAGDYFDEEGELKSEATRKVMQRFIDAYAAWVETILRPAPANADGEAFLLRESRA